MSVTINGTSGIVFNDASAQNTAASGFGFKNRLINGAMVISQRWGSNAVSDATNTNPYLVDRWSFYGDPASKVTLQQNQGSVTPPVGFINYMGLTSTSAYSPSAGDAFRFQQIIEGLNIADLAWGTASASPVTLSFWVRSSLTGTFGGALSNSALNRSYPFSYTISAANTWEQKSVTIAGDTTGTWLTTNGAGIRVFLDVGCGSTTKGPANAWAGAFYAGVTGGTNVVATNGATFQFTGVQLEKGSTATSFDYRPYGTELALCQRYYYKWLNDTGANLFSFSMTNYTTSDSYGKLFDLPVTMRATPTCSTSGTFNALNSTGSITTAFANKNIDSATKNTVATGGWTGASGLTAGNCQPVATANNAFIQASAEL